MEELDGRLRKAVGAAFGAADAARVLAAAEWAADRLSGAVRASGDPAASHDFRVALILVELGMDADSVCAGLLHDALDSSAMRDTEIPPAAPEPHGAAAAGRAAAGDRAGRAREEIARRFGDPVAAIVEGVSRLAALKARNKTVQAAESLRKMLFAMTRDIRVILVKLADKLDNMRTLKWLPEARQKEIAAECLDIFAPLADRLGVSWIKDELEDLALKALNREAFDQVKDIVAAKKGEREGILARIEDAIKESAAAEGIEVGITARAKHFYSIYQKMRKRAKGAEELYDLLGVRLIAVSENDCYALLGLVHRLWKPIEGRFKDYIAMPKANGYRSLHTTVMSYEGRILEVQIRTEAMHRVAEYGVASHWLYKKGSTAGMPDVADLPLVNRLRDWSGFLSSGTEFLEGIKRELLKDSIFVFTPRGDVIELPAGSGPLDFAYAIHSDVGNRCVGAKADGAIVPLDGELRNTQVVEILTSPNAHPTMNWLPLARTSKARSRIRAWLVQSGQALAIEKSIVAGRKGPGAEKADEARADVPRADVPGAVPTMEFRAWQPGEALRNERAGVAIGDARGLVIRIAGCCRPVTGDRIAGYVSRGRGIIVHRADCRSLAAIPDAAERRIEVSWETTTPFVTVRFRVVAKRRAGIFSEIEAAVHKLSGRLREGRLGEVGDGSLSGSFTLELENREDVKKAAKALRAVPSVLTIEIDE